MGDCYGGFYIYIYFLIFFFFKPSYRDGYNALIQYESLTSSATFVTQHIFPVLSFAILINYFPPRGRRYAELEWRF